MASDATRAALVHKLSIFAHRHRAQVTLELSQRLSRLWSLDGWDLLREETLRWHGDSDLNRSLGREQTAGFEKMSKLAAHLLGAPVESIDLVSLRPTVEQPDAWFLSVGYKRGSGGVSGSEMRVHSEEILEGLEAVFEADAAGKMLAGDPSRYPLLDATDASLKVIVFVPAPGKRVHRFSLTLDRRLLVSDARKEAFDRAIARGVIEGGLDDYEVLDSAGNLVSVEAPLWRVLLDLQQHPVVFELRKRRKEGLVDVEVHVDGKVVVNGFRREDTLFQVVRASCVAAGLDPATEVKVKTLAGALVEEEPLPMLEVVGVLAGDRSRVVLVFELGVVDEVRVQTRLEGHDEVEAAFHGNRTETVRTHVTENDTVESILASVMSKMRTVQTLDEGVWELAAPGGVALSPMHKWPYVRKVFFPEADPVSNVASGAGITWSSMPPFRARSLTPFRLTLRRKDARRETLAVVFKPPVQADVASPVSVQEVNVCLFPSESFEKLFALALEAARAPLPDLTKVPVEKTVWYPPDWKLFDWQGRVLDWRNTVASVTDRYPSAPRVFELLYNPKKDSES